MTINPAPYTPKNPVADAVFILAHVFLALPFRIRIERLREPH